MEVIMTKNSSGPKPGPGLKFVKDSNLSSNCMALLEELQRRIAESEAQVRKTIEDLEAAATAEWNEENPDGIDGRICVFKVVGGRLKYVMKKIPKQKMKRKASEQGDDVFRRPTVKPTESAGSARNQPTATSPAESSKPLGKMAQLRLRMAEKAAKEADQNEKAKSDASE
jgi:hypothetical protein